MAEDATKDMKTQNYDVKVMHDLLCLHIMNISRNQSRRLPYIKARCGDRIGEYLDEQDNVFGSVLGQKEKDNPEADARGLTTYDLQPLPAYEDGKCRHQNLLLKELKEIDIEFCFGPSSKDTAGLQEPDRRMYTDKMKDVRNNLAAGMKKVPAKHYVFGPGEGVGEGPE